MFIFREESQILRDVDFLYCNKRCLRSDTLQHALCIVAERTIRFRVELELHWFAFQQDCFEVKFANIKITSNCFQRR